MANKTGLLPYTIEIVEDADAVTAHAGLPLVLETMRKLGVSAKLDAELGLRQRNNGATDSAKSESIVLLMAGRVGELWKIAFSALASEISPIGVEVAWALT